MLMEVGYPSLWVKIDVKHICKWNTVSLSPKAPRFSLTPDSQAADVTIHHKRYIL